MILHIIITINNFIHTYHLTHMNLASMSTNFLYLSIFILLCQCCCNVCSWKRGSPSMIACLRLDAVGCRVRRVCKQIPHVGMWRRVSDNERVHLNAEM